MIQATEYLAVDSEELVLYALNRDNRTALEVELAQRLMVVMDMLRDELEDTPDVDTREQSQVSS